MESTALPDGQEPLDLWLAMEIRRARILFEERKAEDAMYVQAGHQHGGARVKLILQWMEKVAVPLADATLKRAAAFSSSREVIDRAEVTLKTLIQDMSKTALAMAAYVGPDSPSVAQAVKQRSEDLLKDVVGEFLIAAAARGPDVGDSSHFPVPSDKTGLPGRPSSMHLISQIMRERAAAGKMLMSMRQEAGELARLFAADKANQVLAKPKRKGIQNALGSEYRRLKAQYLEPCPEKK